MLCSLSLRLRCRALRMPAGVQGSWNHNLVATFVYRISNSLADGVWDFSIGATYIYFLSGHSNKVPVTCGHRLITCAPLMLSIHSRDLGVGHPSIRPDCLA